MSHSKVELELLKACLEVAEKEREVLELCLQLKEGITSSDSSDNDRPREERSEIVWNALDAILDTQKQTVKVSFLIEE